jgi:hypothetical protein
LDKFTEEELGLYISTYLLLLDPSAYSEKKRFISCASEPLFGSLISELSSELSLHAKRNNIKIKKNLFIVLYS